MKKIYIETYGCASSQNDSEIMTGFLSKKFKIVDDLNKADIVIINTCIVKSTTENKMRFRIAQLYKKFGNKLIVSGCMPEAQSSLVRNLAPKASMISTNKIKKIVSVVESVLKGQRCEILGKVKDEKVNLPKIRKNPIVDILEICSGCNYACSYCITKLAKGQTLSYDYETILKQMRCSIESGVKEFWFTGQDVAAYNYKGKKLPELLEFIEKNIQGDYTIRLGMMHPSNLKTILKDLMQCYKDNHLFKFIHLPVQSGSDNVLEKMRRNYSISDFKKIVSSLRKSIPNITIWTDIIVGFPGETESEFRKTLELLNDIKPDFSNVSRYSMRPGTFAAKMKQLPTEIKKTRSREASKIVNKLSLQANKRWIGNECNVLVDEFNETKGNWIARNLSYKPVVLKEQLKLGQKARVKIVSAERTYLLGKLI